MKRLLTCLCLLTAVLTVWADGLDNLRERMEDNAQVQEKVYVHMDNTCYFIGDTVWYKAYVFRADDLTLTDMSKILYVELLSPDGLVVERQRVVVGNGGYSCGQFALKDSLYSGFYEIRAYTRWMLNFNVQERSYTRDARHMFYNNQMAKDFFRDWQGLYSRVFPVYSKPEQRGNYTGRYMYSRPKQYMLKHPSEKLQASFYPEGGHLVKGLPCRVAFELTNQDGEAVDVEGKLSDGTPVKTLYMGRGMVELTSTNTSPKATFTWKGKSYTFNLPKVEETGFSLKYDHGQVTVCGAGAQVYGRNYALAVMCRGQLTWFDKFTAAEEKHVVELPMKELPTGVNELVVVNEGGIIQASRLFFVNNHDMSSPLTIDTHGKSDYQPYEAVTLTAQSETPALFSISVRDAGADEVSYDDGNIMTDMLLSSELKGFIAHPAYYFESDDEQHQTALDLLMMVQGWRRYRTWPERYQPEKSLVFEGTVNKMLGIPTIEDLDQEALLGMKKGDMGTAMLEAMSSVPGGVSTNVGQQDGLGLEEEVSKSAEQEYQEAIAISVTPTDGLTEEGLDSYLGVNHGNAKGAIIVEAEITDGEQVAGATTRIDKDGRFAIQLPPFYDEAILMVKAYSVSDSLKKCMTSGVDKGILNENAYSDYYVKQDVFYPVFSHPYSFYQTHFPDFIISDLGDIDDDYEVSNDQQEDVHADKKLKTVHVKARRRGKRGVDYTKPAHVVDAYTLYNDATDRGLSWGVVNMATFPYKAVYSVYGNMNRSVELNVRARINNYTFSQNYVPEGEGQSPTRTAEAIRKDLHLSRINNLRFYTDFELRSLGDSLPYRAHSADVTVVYETFPDDAKQITYRDRRYIYPGFTYPEAFYNPDYSTRPTGEATDYRRTLYRNPNARTDKDGKFEAKFYNNSKETRIKVNAAGITADGKFVFNP